MNIKEAEKNWNELGKDDPLYIVLTYKDKRGGKWDPKEFFETGESEIAKAFEYAKSKNISIKRGFALDFGCGVGRLSQALAKYFDQVEGVDISASMLEAANKFNSFVEKCQYHLNTSHNLSLFRDNKFDFVYSRITLQHIRTDYSKNYIKEFTRVLHPGGVLMFQVTSEPIINQPTGIKGFIKKIIPNVLLKIYKRLCYENGVRIPMFGVPRPEVEEILRNNNMDIIDVKADNIAGGAWTSYMYLAIKK